MLHLLLLRFQGHLNSNPDPVGGEEEEEGAVTGQVTGRPSNWGPNGDKADLASMAPFDPRSFGMSS